MLGDHLHRRDRIEFSRLGCLGEVCRNRTQQIRSDLLILPAKAGHCPSRTSKQLDLMRESGAIGNNLWDGEGSVPYQGSPRGEVDDLSTCIAEHQSVTG